MDLLFTCLLVITTVAQIPIQTRASQQEEIRRGPWTSNDQDVAYNYGENSQNDVVDKKESSNEEYNKLGLDLEQDGGSNLDAEDKHDIAVVKRGALEHRLRGKKRRMMKHNKLVHNGVSRQQIHPKKEQEEEIEAGNPKLQEGSNHLDRSQNSFKKGKSKLRSKSSNEYSSSNTGLKTKENVGHSVEKSEGNKDVPGDTMNESPMSVTGGNKPIIIYMKEDDFKRFTSESPVEESHRKSDLHSPDSKENHDLQGEIYSKMENNEDNSNDSDEIIDEKKIKTKKSQKAQNKAKKLKESVEKNEENNDKDYLKPKETNLEKLIKIKTTEKDAYASDDYTKYANMSIINQGFMNSLERKYLALQNEADPKMNNQFASPITNRPVFNIDPSHYKNVVVLDKTSYKNSKKVPDLEEEIETEQENEPKDNEIGSSKQEGDFEQGSKNPIEQSHYTLKPQAKTYIHSRMPKNNKTTYSFDEDDEKRKIRAKKKAHNKGNTDLVTKGKHEPSRDYKAISLRSSKGSSLSEDRPENVQVEPIKEVETNQRKERAIKKNSQNLKGYHPNGRSLARSSQSQFLNTDGNYQYDSSNQQDEPDSRFEGKEEEDEDEEDHLRVHQPNSKRYLANKSHHNGNKIDEYIEGDDESKKLFARRAHVARYNGDDSPGTDECVEYKAEKVTRTTTEETPTESQLTSSSAKFKTTSKTKTTSRTNNKSQTTKTVNSENDQNSFNEKLDEYGQFLCGQLADNFVSAVMDKVHRSRKIMKELGFNNDTDENCDRCIEMKPSNIPDPDTLRSSLDKCVKSSGSKQTKCFKVPKPLESFLFLLLSYEQQHENSVYNKIRDESSFIFTGDYPESLTPNENNAAVDKYNDGGESFNKESFEKHLKDEDNEEKNEDEIVNRGDVRKSSMSGEENVFEEWTDAANEENDNEEVESETKASSSRKKYKKLKSDLGEQNSMQLEASLKGNEASDMLDTKDLFSPILSRYSPNKESEIYMHDSIDSNPIKRRRKIYSNDKFRGYNHAAEPNGKTGTPVNDQFENGILNSYPVKNDFSKYSQYDRDSAKDLNPKMHGSIGQQYNNPFHPHRKNNELFDSASDNSITKFVNYFAHPSKTFTRDKFNAKGSYGSQYQGPDSFLSSNSENNEYQLFPRDASMDGRDGNKFNYDSLRMVKRDAEPSYEDEPVFFEVPDIEYDLY